MKKVLSRTLSAKRLLSPFLLLALCFSYQPSLAQSPGSPPEPGLEEVLEGFDTTEQPTELDNVLDGFEDQEKGEQAGGKESAPGEEPSKLRFSGEISFSGIYNFSHDAPAAGRTDHRGFSRLRPRIDLELETRGSSRWKLKIAGYTYYDLAYSFNGRDKYTSQMLDENETETELEEAWLSASLSSAFDIKIGRQISVWGKSDNIRVVDVLNPLDLREPGLVDIEDLRLPVAMTKLDFYRGAWNLSAHLMHEFRPNKTPSYGSDFYPFNTPPPPEDKPDDWKDDPEFGLALKGIFSGWDISFFLAQYHDRQAHLETVMTASGILQFKRCYSRLQMLGFSTNVAAGNWLFKMEGAYINGLEYLNLPGEEKARLDLLFGLDYSGFTNTTITFEIVNRRLLDYDDRLKNAPDVVEEDDIQSVFRLTRTFYNDSLELTFLASTYGLTGENGSLQRFTLEYDLTDKWTVTGGVVLYQSGDKPSFSSINNNDRLYFEIKYAL